MIQAIDIGLIQNLDRGAQKASRIDLPVSAGVQARSQAGCSHGADGEPRDRRSGTRQAPGRPERGPLDPANKLPTSIDADVEVSAKTMHSCGG
ncbi:hypothetical protein V1318_01910 [Lysobacter sp. CCNWLW3]|uniref:hypothetical protein n=1 Tax=unclassified Lysobacter TaxID=2635362 RepID=UPI002FCECCDE